MEAMVLMRFSHLQEAKEGSESIRKEGLRCVVEIWRESELVSPKCLWHFTDDERKQTEQ
jgi:hypothetical protein